MRLSVEDSVASAIVRSGVGAAADPAESGALSAGGALDAGSLTEVALQHGGGRVARVMLPYSVALVGAAAGVLASIGKPIAASIPANPASPQALNTRAAYPLTTNPAILGGL